jgi:chromosome partitioning protein
VLKDTEALAFLNAPLGTRKAFGNAAAQGLAVTELKPQDPKATEEVLLLYRYIFDSSEISRLKAAGA